MTGRLIRAQTTKSKTISCKGQGLTYWHGVNRDYNLPLSVALVGRMPDAEGFGVNPV